MLGRFRVRANSQACRLGNPRLFVPKAVRTRSDGSDRHSEPMARDLRKVSPFGRNDKCPFPLPPLRLCERFYVLAFGVAALCSLLCSLLRSSVIKIIFFRRNPPAESCILARGLVLICTSHVHRRGGDACNRR